MSQVVPMKKNDDKSAPNPGAALKAAIVRFGENDKYVDDYRHFTPVHGDVLVRLMVYRPAIKSKKDSLLLPDAKGQFKSKEEVLDVRIIPMVRIIRTAKDSIFKEGDLYTVPRSDVLGSVDNPDYLNYIRSFGDKAENKVLDVKPPPGMPRKILNLDKYWNQYLFVRPWIMEAEQIDMEMYLIPVSKLKTLVSWDGLKG